MWQRSPKDSVSCTVRVSPLPNKLNEIKEKRSNIKFDSVVKPTKLSHETLMVTFKEFRIFDPGEYETPMNCKAVHSNVFVPPY
ncbi:hypothetical protein PIROE2DRAFT_6437 [Piromyces sp. E2]|nr:hypothetical protein PIROE2DRAFT_6437 [Piromyces sp. E2]|eukprot:OUM66391.1 hypothetical protein PIROE2DRAFT_6437 [Piromyces sp. E2]